jgi:hypothetical protein
MAMQNFYTVIGRLKKFDLDKGIMKIRVDRTDEVENQIIPVLLSQKLIDNCKGYLFVNDIVGVKGYIRIERGLVKLYASKISFLSKGTER